MLSRPTQAEIESHVICRYTSGTEGETKADPPPLVRPEFPPPSLAFTRLLPHELPDAAGGDLLFIWSFLRSFGDLLGLTTLTVDQLLQSLVDGSRSRVLAEVHIAMLRIVQADMEEAHATGAMQVLFPILKTFQVLLS